MKHSGFIPEKLYAAHLCVDFSPPPPPTTAKLSTFGNLIWDIPKNDLGAAIASKKRHSAKKTKKYHE